VFDWRGKPSIFTTSKDRANYIGANHDRARRSSERVKMSPIELPGSSPNLPLHTMRSPYSPKMKDVLRSGGEVGKK
jgi:hypothetical protein